MSQTPRPTLPVWFVALMAIGFCGLAVCVAVLIFG
jgi:hypothetical protein